MIAVSVRRPVSQSVSHAAQIVACAGLFGAALAKSLWPLFSHFALHTIFLRLHISVVLYVVCTVCSACSCSSVEDSSTHLLGRLSTARRRGTTTN